MSETHLPIGLGSTKTLSRKEYLQQYSLLHVRIRQREQAIHKLKQHLKHGTFPKNMKTLKPYPKMENPQTQAKVNEVCQQAEKVILEQKLQDYECKQEGDRTKLQALKEARRKQRQQQKAAPAPKPSKTVSVSQLQQELRDLQAKYTELSQKLTPTKPKPQLKDITS